MKTETEIKVPEGYAIVQPEHWKTNRVAGGLLRWNKWSKKWEKSGYGLGEKMHRSDAKDYIYILPVKGGDETCAQKHLMTPQSGDLSTTPIVNMKSGSASNAAGEASYPSPQAALPAPQPGGGGEAGKVTVRIEWCEECGSPLSHCGDQDSDGEPELDCSACQLREKLHETYAECNRLTAERDDYKRRFLAICNQYACGDCDPCLSGRADQCAISSFPKSEIL